MDWIYENLKFVIIALFIIGSIVKSRLDSKNQGPDGLPDVDENEVPERSSRKMPPRLPSVPPPVIRTNSPIPRASSPPPPLPIPTAYTTSGAYAAAEEEAAEMLKHQQDLAEHLRQLRATKATTTGGAAATRARVAASKSKAKPQSTVPLSIRARLRNPAEVRRAFVLREILDKPVGLR